MAAHALDRAGTGSSGTDARASVGAALLVACFVPTAPRAPMRPRSDRRLPGAPRVREQVVRWAPTDDLDGRARRLERHGDRPRRGSPHRG